MNTDELIEPHAWADAVRQQHNGSPMWIFLADNPAAAEIFRALLSAYLASLRATGEPSDAAVERDEHPSLTDIIRDAVTNTRRRPAGLRGPYVITDEELDDMLAVIDRPLASKQDAPSGEAGDVSFLRHDITQQRRRIRARRQPDPRWPIGDEDIRELEAIDGLLVRVEKYIGATAAPTADPRVKAYRCPVCGVANPNAYLRCSRPDCPDGRDPR